MPSDAISPSSSNGIAPIGSDRSASASSSPSRTIRRSDSPRFESVRARPVVGAPAERAESPTRASITRAASQPPTLAEERMRELLAPFGHDEAQIQAASQYAERMARHVLGLEPEPAWPTPPERSSSSRERFQPLSARARDSSRETSEYDPDEEDLAAIRQQVAVANNTGALRPSDLSHTQWRGETTADGTPMQRHASRELLSEFDDLRLYSPTTSIRDRDRFWEQVEVAHGTDRITSRALQAFAALITLPPPVNRP